MAGVVKFTEKQRTILLHDYMVYICGVDVSGFISDLSITFNDRNSPNSADFSLTNALDQFILTPMNLVNNKWRMTSDRYTEAPKFQIYQAKRHLSKRVSGGQVLKVNPEAEIPEDDATTYTSTQLANAANSMAADFMAQDFLERYAFGVGSSIFSRFDTVRIFVKNPYDHQDADRWIPFFTGTIQNKPFSTNFITGESKINIAAMDIRAEMSGMRVSANPWNNNMFGVGNSNELDQRANTVFFDSEQAGFFKDFYPTDTTRPKTDNIFANKGFVDMASMLITGLTGWAGNDLSFAKDGDSKVVNEGSGVGFFKPGQVIRYGNANNSALTKKSNYRSDLEEWDNLCLFGISKNFFTKSDCLAIGRASFWYRFDNNAKVNAKEKLTRFTPFDGHVHFLMPAEGLKIASMIVQSFDGFQNIMKNPDWTNRFELITRICQMVDYEWTVTGNGDIVFEFPMYDFYPESFGSNASIYTVDRHVKSDQIADESGEIPAAIEATTDLTLFGDKQVNDAFKSTSENAAAGMTSKLVKAVVVSPILASKYGARIVSHTFTGVPIEGLNKAATLEFQKRLADANKLSFDYSYRPYVRPNRPLFHKTRGRMGKTNSVSYNLPLYPSAPSNSASIHCVKTPLFKNGKNIFQHITGAANMPLSYNAVFEKEEIDTDGGMNIINNNQGEGKQITTPEQAAATTGTVRSTLNKNSNPNWTRFDHLFEKYGAKYGVPADVLKAISLNETQLGTDPRTSKGLENPSDIYGSRSMDGKSWGIMQMRYNVAKLDYEPNLRVEDLNNPDVSVRIAAQHLAKSYKAFGAGDLEHIVKSYNRGITGTKTDKANNAYNVHVAEYWERFQRNFKKVQPA